MKRPIQQGQADGLCGLYSLLHFLQDLPDFVGSTNNDILWALLDAARNFGWLDPHTLTNGFEDFQIKKIAEKIVEDYRMGYVVHYLRDVRQATHYKSTFDLLSAVTSKGGAAITYRRQEDHWVCVRSSTIGAEVVDSYRRKAPRVPLDKDQHKFSRDWGIIILPQMRHPIEVEI